MNKKVFSGLSLMMFLQFFIWGAWYVTIGNYMAKIGMSDIIYLAYTVMPIAAMISPFFLGMIADRYFATERVLAILHLLGGAAIMIAPIFAEGPNQSPTMFILMMLLHTLCYMPTIGLVNTLSFHHLDNLDKQFPIVRVFGTVGWIVSNIIVSRILHADETAIPLYTAGIACFALGVFSFFLPHTPPPAKGKKATWKEVFGIDALKKLSSFSFNTFIISSILICIPLSVYYAYGPVFVNASGITNPAFRMSFGQVSEAVFILLIPILFARLGVKKMLLAGIFAWVLRYALFALGAPEADVWMIMFGIILHGICFDFFFVTGQIYVDMKASVDIRGQAQGLIVFATWGVGMFIGSQIAGKVFNNTVGENIENLSAWQNFWWIPAIFAAIVMFVFMVLFKDDTKK